MAKLQGNFQLNLSEILEQVLSILEKPSHKKMSSLVSNSSTMQASTLIFNSL